LDSIRENIRGIDLQPFLFGEVDAGVRGFARRICIQPLNQPSL